VGIALLAAGCGGAAKSPSVASLGTTPSSGSSTSSIRVCSTGCRRIRGSMSTQVGTARPGSSTRPAFAPTGCRTIPDPDGQGTITITVSASLNPSSPLFQKAEADCQHLIPAGKPLSQTRHQQMKQRLLAFSACMRSHGFPHYRDPTVGPAGWWARALAGVTASIRTHRSSRQPRRPVGAPPQRRLIVCPDRSTRPAEATGPSRGACALILVLSCAAELGVSRRRLPLWHEADDVVVTVGHG
jgi:hypothetical protein